MTQILVLNGPNLNLLGEREPDQYGQRSLAEIMQEVEEFAQTCGLEFASLQSNSEGALVDAIQQASRDNVDYIIINPAGYTHTSVAIRDALLATEIPFIEVHLSAVQAREPTMPIRYACAVNVPRTYKSGGAAGISCSKSGYSSSPRAMSDTPAC